MEIERKWEIGGFPDGLPQTDAAEMRQGYLVTDPVVRIRAEQRAGGGSHIPVSYTHLAKNPQMQKGPAIHRDCGPFYTVPLLKPPLQSCSPSPRGKSRGAGKNSR